MLTAESVYQIAKELSQEELIKLQAKIDANLKLYATSLSSSKLNQSYSRAELQEMMIYRLSNGLGVKDLMDKIIQLKD